jgi:hypothetical protein
MHQKGFSSFGLLIALALLFAAGGAGYAAWKGKAPRNFEVSVPSLPPLAPGAHFEDSSKSSGVPTKIEKTVPTQPTNTNAVYLSATPKSGTAPLAVTIEVEQPKEYGKGYVVDFGNGHSDSVTGDQCGNYQCADTRGWQTMYKRSGVYHITVNECTEKDPNYPWVCTAGEIVATEMITVQ